MLAMFAVDHLWLGVVGFGACKLDELRVQRRWRVKHFGLHQPLATPKRNGPEVS